MKKKTIATSLLTILVATYATPFIANAEEITGSSATPTASTEAPTASTEAPTASTEAPTASTEAPTASTEAPTASTEAPAVKDEVKTPNTKKSVTSRKTPQEVEDENKFNALYSEVLTLIESANNEGILSTAAQGYDQYASLKAQLNAATTIAELQQIKDNIYTYVLNPHNNSILPGIKQDAINQLDEWKNYGQITEEAYNNAVAAINAAQNAEAVAQVIANVETQMQADIAATLENIKNDAKDQIFAWFNEGGLSAADYAYYLDAINGAADAETVAAFVASAEQQVQQNGLNVDLDQVKNDARDQLFSLLSYGQINDNQYVNAINAINDATSVDEVNAILQDVQDQIDAEAAAVLAQIKEDAKDQLFEWYNDGLLTVDQYNHYLNQVVNAAGAEDVALIMALAEQQAQENALHHDGDDVINKPVVDNPVVNKPVTEASNELVAKPSSVKNTETKQVVTKVAKEDKKAKELPKTGEANQSFTALGLVSVALASFVAVFKRKKS